MLKAGFGNIMHDKNSSSFWKHCLLLQTQLIDTRQKKNRREKKIINIIVVQLLEYGIHVFRLNHTKMFSFLSITDGSI